MSKSFLVCLTALLFLGSLLPAQVFINEFHYDNASIDQDEGIEIAGPAGTDLSCYKILIYNGASGLVNNTLTLNGTIPDICNGYGAVWFPSSLQNGPNDGFALVYDPSLCSAAGSAIVVQFLSYEGTFTAANGEAAGMLSDSLPIAESNSTPVGHSAQLTGNGSAYGDFTWTSTASSHNLVNPGQSFNGPCGAVVPSELRFTSTPTGCTTPGQAFSITVCATNGSGTVDTSYSGTVTLTHASGPGTLSGASSVSFSGGCATFAGLSLDQPGTHTFTATDGSLGGSSPNAYINSGCSQCPNMSGAMIDACGVGEGRNEILFFNSGDYAIPLQFPAFSLTYGGSSPPATSYSNGFTSNLAYIDSLNNLAGCALFVDAYTNAPIPPNTAFMVMRSNPDYGYDFGAWCSQAPIYVAFSTDANWVELGNFKNCVDCDSAESGTNIRYFRSDLSSLTNGAPCDFTYSYTPCTDLVCPGGGTSSSNGDGISWPYGGGPIDSAWNECTPTAPSLLPVLYGSPLTARWEEGRVRLSWTTELEVNTAHFEIERAGDPAGRFETLGAMPARGNSTEPSRYDWWDAEPMPGPAFYRVRQVDLDGSWTYSRTVEIGIEQVLSEIQSLAFSENGAWLDIAFSGEGKAEALLYSISGTLVGSTGVIEAHGNAELRLSTASLAAGLYLYDLRIGNERHAGRTLLIK